MFKENVKKPWFIRKIIYLILSIIITFLTAFGIISIDGGEQITNQVYEVVTQILAVLALGYASAKTHKGSDSIATDKDLAARHELEAIQGAQSGGYVPAVVAQVEPHREDHPVESSGDNKAELPVYNADTSA